MESILTAAEMRAADAEATNHHGIPSLVLMENAARGVIDAMIARYGTLSGKQILVMCGKGNNGGDGLAVARLANIVGAAATAVLLFPPEQLSPDAAAQLSILNSFYNNPVVTWQSKKWRKLRYDIVVDAVLGIGSSGELRQPISNAVNWMNQHGAPVVAVDLPTGIDADTGNAATVTVKADQTVVMGAWKPGVFLGDGPDYTGTVSLAHTGLPSEGYPDRLSLLNHESAALRIPPIFRIQEKYGRGNVVVVAGSRGMAGAGILSATGALRAGAGLVVLRMPTEAALMPHNVPAEVMLRLIHSDNYGALNPENGVEGLLKEISIFNVLAIGPGLSRSPGVAKIVRHLVLNSPIPTVVDADALHAFAGQAVQLAYYRQSRLILTPHHGELARLMGITRDAVSANPLAIAKKAAVVTMSLVVLKGAPTVIADPSGMAWILQAGNPGMATAGSGDVLTGIIASLIAQSGKVVSGTLLGVYLHSHAGDLAAAAIGQQSMTAGDIIAHLPQAYKSLQ